MQPLAPKVVAWVLALTLSLLIIASHKHYTVDVTVAWYTVPLVFLALERRYTTKRKEGDDLPVRSMTVRPSPHRISTASAASIHWRGHPAVLQYIPLKWNPLLLLQLAAAAARRTCDGPRSDDPARIIPNFPFTLPGLLHHVLTPC